MDKAAFLRGTTLPSPVSVLACCWLLLVVLIIVTFVRLVLNLRAAAAAEDSLVVALLTTRWGFRLMAFMLLLSLSSYSSDLYQIREVRN